MNCKICGKSKADHEKPLVLPADAFTKCPVCHHIAKDFDDLIDHIEESCQKGLDDLYYELRAHPRVCERFMP